MEELDIKKILQMIWNKKLLVIIVTIIAMIAAAVYSYALQKPKYQSTTSLVLAQIRESEDGTTSSITTSDISMNEKLIGTYSQIIKSNTVLRPVIKNLNLSNISEEALKSSITVKAVTNTDIINITVTNDNAEDAAKIANEIGRVFAETVEQQYKLNNVYILDEAEPANNPYNIRPKKYIAIAAAIGIVLSCAYIVIRELFDSTVKTSDEIEKLLEIPVIAQISNASIYAKGGRR